MAMRMVREKGTYVQRRAPFKSDRLTGHEPGWEHRWLPIPKGFSGGASDARRYEREVHEKLPVQNRPAHCP